jgi:hypothetical protein
MSTLPDTPATILSTQPDALATVRPVSGRVPATIKADLVAFDEGLRQLVSAPAGESQVLFRKPMRRLIAM